ncbi:polysaccharide deacetylase family protein [Adhaeribacter rhizoryzae]|uniref:Polysaccharide deacetylase family protein n=1 Tax=Adhaeribacter rhizoryzae TaxID=2607907 RepID=A0A5M6D2U5_9BACT|nr:polysaccharide deacetylase family protein [Adhaeribacter rhizoryzae]KAA5540602.1 polysaccharide deacetylase family protein [Adhaeribacter rhizoryzae]
MQFTLCPNRPFTRFTLIFFAVFFLIVSCSEPAQQTENTAASQEASNIQTVSASEPKAETPAPEGTNISDALAASETKVADAATILARKQVPILCYHQIRNWTNRDSKSAKDYIVPEETFRAQLKMLYDSGYQTILPDQLYAYLTTGAPLPPKPIMLTFDDTDLDQFTVAAPTMQQYGFKGVFFIMTVSLGRPRYMTRAQVKELADAGHVIGSHTWDHQNVKKLKGQDWVTQIDKPTEQLKAITGKEIKYFAYPFGLWSPEVIPELKKRGFTAAFQLSTKRDPEEPLFTIRRTIASGYWSPGTLHNTMLERFK